MVTKGRLYLSLALLCLLSLVVACATPAPQPAPSPTPTPTAKPVPSPTAASPLAQWKFAIVTPAGQVYSDMYKDLSAGIASSTNGQVKVTLYTAGELPQTAAEYLRATRDNLIEMTEILGVSVIGDEPWAGLADLPYIALNEKDLATYRNMTTSRVVSQFENKWNVKVILTGAYGPRQLFTRTPVSGLKDLKGLRIRGVGGLEPDLIKAWDAVPSMISWAECYTAAQRGIIDGVLTATTGIETGKIYEVCPYATMINAEVPNLYVSVNKGQWNALPKDIQGAIAAYATQWTQKWDPKLRVQWDIESLDRMVKAGNVKSVTKIAEQDMKATRDKIIPVALDYLKQRIGPEGVDALQQVLKALGVG